jgi:hypothetical protein
MHTLAAIVVGTLAFWCLLKGLLTGMIDAGGIKFDRKEEPLEYWGAAMLVAGIALGSVLWLGGIIKS